LCRTPKAALNFKSQLLQPLALCKLILSTPAFEAFESIGDNILFLFRVPLTEAGEIHTTVQYGYNGNTGDGSAAGLTTLANALASVINSASNVSGAIKGNGAAFSSAIASDFNALNFFNNQSSPSNNNRPKAFLNVIFFDEQFKFDAVSSYSEQIGTASTGQIVLALGHERKANKSGYCYIYISNESNDFVHFDNFTLTHKRSALLEETHYYPHGLKMAGICSEAFGAIQNAYQYQGVYAEYDDETGWNDFELRSYDAQIGRFIQQDPYDQFPSPYTGIGNDPVNNIDKDGGWSAGLTAALIGTVGGGVAGYLIAKNNGASTLGAIGAGLGGALIGAGLGYGIGETLFPRIGYEASFSNNVAAFYKGLFGGAPGDIVKLNNGVCGPNAVGAIVPDLWSWAGNINLPSFDFLKSGKDVFEIGEKIVLNAIFIQNEANIDFTQTDKKQLDQTVDKIVRTLRKNKDAGLPLSGGTDNPETVNNPTKPPPKEIQDLLRDRVKTIRDYIQQRARPKKIINRVYDNGKIIRGNKLVTGTLSN
jgi:RHS repeat-associated protein